MIRTSEITVRARISTSMTGLKPALKAREALSTTGRRPLSDFRFDLKADGEDLYPTFVIGDATIFLAKLAWGRLRAKLSLSHQVISQAHKGGQLGIAYLVRLIQSMIKSELSDELSILVHKHDAKDDTTWTMRDFLRDYERPFVGIPERLFFVPAAKLAETLGLAPYAWRLSDYASSLWLRPTDGSTEGLELAWSMPTNDVRARAVLFLDDTMTRSAVTERDPRTEGLETIARAALDQQRVITPMIQTQRYEPWKPQMLTAAVVRHCKHKRIHHTVRADIADQLARRCYKDDTWNMAQVLRTTYQAAMETDSPALANAMLKMGYEMLAVPLQPVKLADMNEANKVLATLDLEKKPITRGNGLQVSFNEADVDAAQPKKEFEPAPLRATERTSSGTPSSSPASASKGSSS